MQQRLDQMDEQQVSHFLSEQLAHLSFEEEFDLRHEDYTMDMPQSGERIRGRDRMRAFQAFEAPAWRSEWVERMDPEAR